MGPELDSPDANVVPDFDPISIPDQNNTPTVDDRLTHIEDVLHINP